MRDTSLLAYQQIQPKLGSRQQTVLIWIHGHPDCTDKDIATGLSWTINCVVPRRNELEKKGWVRSSGYTVQDGRRVHVWEVKT
jgi:DNA-binding MarR family transcriptional regulator